MSLSKIEFYNAADDTLIKTVSPVPASPFTVCFDDIVLVPNDKYLEVWAKVYFENGTFTIGSTPVKAVVNETSLVDFDTALAEFVTADTLTLDGTLDLSEVTQFTVDAGSVGKFVFEYKKFSDASYTSTAVVTPVPVANVFTESSPTMDLTADDKYVARWKWVDSLGVSSAWTYKIIVKDLYVGVDNAGTDAWCWDNACTSKVTY